MAKLFDTKMEPHRHIQGSGISCYRDRGEGPIVHLYDDGQSTTHTYTAIFAFLAAT